MEALLSSTDEEGGSAVYAVSGARRTMLFYQVLTVSVIVVAYMGIIICVTSIGTAIPAMKQHIPGFNATQAGSIVASGNAGVVIGKFFTGAFADKLGGRMTFCVAMGVISVSSAGMGVLGSTITTYSPTALYCIALFILRFAHAAGWPALARIIPLWFSPDHYALVWGIFATSSRIANVCTGLLLGAVLLSAPWPWVFYAGCLWSSGGFLLCLLLLRDSPAHYGLEPFRIIAAHDEDAEEEKPPFFRALAGFLKNPSFWFLIVGSFGVSQMVELFSFVALFLQENFGSVITSAARASLASSVFPLGSAVVIVFAGFLYDRLDPKKRNIFISSTLFVALLCPISLYLIIGSASSDSDEGLGGTLAILFIFGGAIAPSFYLPMGVYCLTYGGEWRALLAGIIDGSGYCGSLVFNAIGGTILDSYGWPTFLMVAAGFSLIGVTFMTIHLIRESWVHKRSTAELL